MTRAGDDRGAAMVEFALVSSILVLFVLGIINFGLILSFKQDVTRAAAEGARVGAITLPPAGPVTSAATDSRYIQTVAATNTAVDSFGKTCGVDGMVCEVIVHDCDSPPVAGDISYAAAGNTLQDCVTVHLAYDYDAYPIIVEPPILAGFLPDSIEATSVVRLNQ